MIHNRWAAALVAGAITGAAIFFKELPKEINWREMVSDVGLAFLAPFLLIIKVLPSADPAPPPPPD